MYNKGKSTAFCPTTSNLLLGVVPSMAELYAFCPCLSEISCRKRAENLAVTIICLLSLSLSLSLGRRASIYEISPKYHSFTGIFLSGKSLRFPQISEILQTSFNSGVSSPYPVGGVCRSSGTFCPRTSPTCFLFTLENKIRPICQC